MGKHCSNGHCGHCLSRRDFLTKTTLAAAGVALAAPGRLAWSETDLGEYIPLESFRPRPKVRIMSALIRYKPPYWLGWPGTSYDLEGHREEYDGIFAQMAEKVGVDLENEESPLESEQAVNEFIEKVKAETPDALLISIQHLNVWGLAERVTEAGIPTIVFAPVGTAFTGHIGRFSKNQGVHVISSLETSAVEQAFRMVRAKRQFEESRLLVVAGGERSESVLECLGTKVRYVPRDVLHELFAKMPENDEAREVARSVRKRAKKVIEPSKEDTLNMARSFMTAKRLMRDERANAITTDCLGMVSGKVVPTPPCMAVSMFQDAGVTYGCEADVFGAISLMFSSYLFDKPGFMNDPVPETVKNVLIAAHCSSGTKLNGFDQPAEPFYLRSHSESDIGVAPQVLWRVGQPVTLVRFQSPSSLIVDTGTVVGNVNTPPAGGCRTSFEIEMDRVRDSRNVLGFHQVVFYGNHRRDVEAFCQMYGLKATHSPEEA